MNVFSRTHRFPEQDEALLVGMKGRMGEWVFGERLAMSAETTLQRFEECDLNSPKSLL